MIYNPGCVSLAQLVERHIDIVEATGSSPVRDTILTPRCGETQVYDLP
jgi:hypothetical protein